MSDRDAVLELVRAAEAALERNRARLDDLNVYPVPDGDTGTNMLLTVRSVTETLQQTVTRSDRAGLAQEFMPALVRRGDQAVQETREQLDVLREAGVVDAGAAGLVEILRGIAAHLAGEPLPEAPPAEPLAPQAVHQEASRYRYCAVFVVEGEGLQASALE